MLNSVFCVINTSHHALATMFLAVLGQTIVHCQLFQTVAGTDTAIITLWIPTPFERSDLRRLFKARRLNSFPVPYPRSLFEARRLIGARRLNEDIRYIHFRLALAHVSSMSKKEGPCMQTVHLCLAAGQRCDSDANCNLAPTPRYSPSNMDQAGTCARSRQKTYMVWSDNSPDVKLLLDSLASRGRLGFYLVVYCLWSQLYLIIR